jgi:TRAP-type C4-dicarboxylate transport system permease large subunit
VERILRELIVFYVPLFGMILVLTLSPKLSLWLPSRVLGN